MDTQIWLAKAGGSSWDLRLLLAPPLMLDGACYATFEAPKLGADNRVLYFIIDSTGIDGEVVALDIGTKKARSVAPALSFDVVDKGPYRGDLVVLQRTIAKDSIVRWYWLVAPDGKKLGYVGSSREDARRFLADAHPVLGKARGVP
jgi:hypothetical protein